MNENKSDFFASWYKELEKDLEQLKEEKQEEIKKHEDEVKEVVKKELAKAERKNAEKIKELENKLRKLCYWLLGIVFFLVITGGMFFYLRSNR